MRSSYYMLCHARRLLVLSAALPILRSVGIMLLKTRATEIVDVDVDVEPTAPQWMISMKRMVPPHVSRQDALDGSRHNVVLSEKKKKGDIQKCISIGNLNTADTDSPQMPETDNEQSCRQSHEEPQNSFPKMKIKHH